jgi:hypothetical protein
MRRGYTKGKQDKYFFMKEQDRDHKSKVSIFVVKGIVLLVFMIICTSQSFAEDLGLSLSSDQGLTNQTATVSLGLAYPGVPLASGFNLDIYYDNDALENPTPNPGQILSDAGKEMSTSEPTHPYFGVLRIVVSGFNQEIIQAGEVATIDFDIKVTSPGGLTVLALTNVEATDEEYQALWVLENDGFIDVIVGDIDEDEIPDNVDNCPFTINPDQVDSYPPDGNDIGDTCECEGNFDCDQDCDGTDAAFLKADFGRSPFLEPCDEDPLCKGNFDCDLDVDGTDASVFKADFGRSPFKNPCPICTQGEWCAY